MFVDTGLEYPEIRNFVKEINNGDYPMLRANVETLRPRMRFDEVIKKYGYPMISKEVAYKISVARRNPLGKCAKRFDKDNEHDVKYGKGYSVVKWSWLKDANEIPISSQCCDIMKKKPFKIYEKEKDKKPFIGTMACESSQRKTSWIKTGCNAFESSRPLSTPLAFWTEQDIYEYISLNNIPIAKVYGEVIRDGNGLFRTTGVTRTGCMFCMFGVHLEKEPNRFQRMKDSHLRQYEYCMKPIEEGGLGLQKVLEFINVPYK